MSTPVKDSSNDIRDVLAVDKRPGLFRRLRWFGLIVLVLALALGSYRLLVPEAGPVVHYETASVQRGDLTVTVAATGTLQPVNQVDVGSELSGTIESVMVDFNDRVKHGQVLARLNTDRLQAQVIEGKASLESGKAKLEEAKATVLETRLRFQRCEKLAERQLCSREDLDTTRAAHARARAAEASARAQVAVAEAVLDADQTNLAKAEIRSPIDGLVLQRQIEPGQTVAASLQAPILFTLAEDLAQMQLHVAVDEADVGKIADGQTAQFSVDAYPDRIFPAQITQVRFAPQTVDGVVTYETVLSVDNSDLSLRPGMTATAVITVQQINDAMLVPNAALRFVPATPRTAQRSSGGGLFGMLFRRPPSGRKRMEGAAGKGQKVWVLKDGQPLAVPVKTGASDGKFTAVHAGGIEPGQAVIVDMTSSK